MKKTILLFSAILLSTSGFAQSNVGLVAHWKMDGDATDASGHGHDGTPGFVTQAAGRAGIPNTAYYFSGSTDTSSIIYVPYSPDFDLSVYSICATVKLSGFYTGLCDANSILARGSSSQSGSYWLYFSNEPYQGCTCAGVDTTEYVFSETAANNGASCSGWLYDPKIVSGQWYSVVGTFDGTDYRIYVNGELKTVNPSTTPNPIGSSVDEIVIGMNIFDGPLYPYPFHGYIDDIRLYNRVLSGIEVAIYDGSTLNVENTNITEEKISISPNPAKDHIRISLPSANLATIQILNTIGQTVLTEATNNKTTDINVSSLPQGTYMARLLFDNHTIVKRFVKD